MEQNLLMQINKALPTDSEVGMYFRFVYNRLAEGAMQFLKVR